MDETPEIVVKAGGRLLDFGTDYTWDRRTGEVIPIRNVFTKGEVVTVEYTASRPSLWTRLVWWWQGL